MDARMTSTETDSAMLRFERHGDLFEMGATIEEDASLQSKGDAYVTVLVQSGRFRGHNDLWVQREALRDFAAQLAALDRDLSGEARLSGVSPDELELVVRAVTSRGHVALSGRTGYFIQGDHGRYWHSVSFGFEFDPGQLSGVLRHSWLARYAAGSSA